MHFPPKIAWVTGQAGGLPEISRGLSAAIPPENASPPPTRPRQGSQIALQTWLSTVRNFCDPCQGRGLSCSSTGGVAALNPRLISSNPPGFPIRSRPASA